MLKLLTVSSLAGVTALAIYAAARDFRANLILVSINEFVRLEANDTQSFTDLATPVEGEIRFESNTTSACKFLLKLNAALSNRSFYPTTVAASPLDASSSSSPITPAPVGSGGGASRPSSFTATSSSAAAANNNNNNNNNATSSSSFAVPLSGLEVNDIVDTWQLQKKHALVFSPACTSHQTLLRYQSIVHEEFSVPVSAREVVVYKKGPGQYLLELELCVHRAILDLEVLLTLPKHAKVLSVNTFGHGTWQPVQGAASDVMWSVGPCGDLDDVAEGAGARGFGKGSEGGWTIATFARVAAKKAAKSRPPPQKCAGGGVAPVQELADKTVARMEPLDEPHAPLGQFLEKLTFQMSYEIQASATNGGGGEEDDDGVATTVASSVSMGGTRKKSNKKHRQKGSAKHRRGGAAASDAPRREEDEDDQFVVVDSTTAKSSPSSLIPAVTLSYGSASAASGLLVRKLQTLSEKVLWRADDPVQSTWFWRTMKRVYPGVDAPTRMSKKAQYLTRFSQALTVTPEWE